jgi:tRNA uridine 5-carbamoylmethylation protein Kti12
MSKPICTVMVGLPAMGKSTRVNEMVAMDLDEFVYSTDRFIEDAAAHFGKTYDDVFEDNIECATKSMNELLDIAIKDGMDIIWDQTNLGVGKRRKIINRMKQAGYQVRGVCIIPPESGWLDDQKVWANRLRNRPGKTIPQNILTNMFESFTVPTVSEGFDMITFYNMHGALLGIDYGEQE